MDGWASMYIYMLFGKIFFVNFIVPHCLWLRLAASAEINDSWLGGLILRNFLLGPPPWGEGGAETDGWMYGSPSEGGKNKSGGRC